MITLALTTPSKFEKAASTASRVAEEGTLPTNTECVLRSAGRAGFAVSVLGFSAAGAAVGAGLGFAAGIGAHMAFVAGAGAGVEDAASVAHVDGFAGVAAAAAAAAALGGCAAGFSASWRGFVAACGSAAGVAVCSFSLAGGWIGLMGAAG